MSLKKDLSIDFLGVKCENPFFLSSSPVGSNYEMCAKALEAGWGGIYYKTIGIFIPDECSPRFDITTKEGTPWVGFKNMEQISDKPLEVNLEYMRRLIIQTKSSLQVSWEVMMKNGQHLQKLLQKLVLT